MKDDVKAEINERIHKLLNKPAYSNNKIIESVCLFFSKYYYRIAINTFYAVKYGYQRLTRGFDDLDKWNVAWYIARKSIPVLEAMRNNFVGTSVRYHTEDRFGNIKELSRDEVFSGDELPVSLTEDEWRGVLDDIIFAFRFTLQQDEIDFVWNEEQYKIDYKRHKRGLALFSIYYGNLWD